MYRVGRGGGVEPQETRRPASMHAAPKRAGDAMEGRNLNQNIWSYVLWG
jgi:hypothetical protein